METPALIPRPERTLTSNLILLGYWDLISALCLGGVGGFDQDESCDEGDEGGEVPFGFLAA